MAFTKEEIERIEEASYKYRKAGSQDVLEDEELAFWADLEKAFARALPLLSKGCKDPQKVLRNCQLYDGIVDELAQRRRSREYWKASDRRAKARIEARKT
jgi:hypothetical protein